MSESTQRGASLVRYARAVLRERLGGATATPLSGAWCSEIGATFVTWRWRDGLLQGCIGTLEPKRGIAADVAHNAVASALFDPRASRVALADVEELAIELSILSPIEPLAFDDEPSALARIRPGVDGIVLEHGLGRATFLPSMWPRLGEVGAFMEALKKKAGLARDAWPDDVRLSRYTVEKHVDPPRDATLFALG